MSAEPASPGQLEFVALGMDHTTAGIELRERVAFTDAEIPRALAQLTDPADPLLEQAAILSTCNRVEVYGAARSMPRSDALAAFLAGYHGLEPREISHALYVHRGDEVAHHLAATAAGMHSLVPGEAQIQGQVRAAVGQALAAGTTGPELRRMFESATAASRRARSQTAIGRGVTSVPRASVEFVRRRRGTLSQSTVLLIGAGNTGELAAKQLVKCGVAHLLVLGRDQLRARLLAARYGGRTITLDRLVEALVGCDVVISSTGAPTPILRRNQVEHAIGLRGPGSGPLVLIDLAVPRDVDQSVVGLAGVELHTIDDLRRVVDRALDHRLAELPVAREILAVEVARFTAWLRRREAAAAA
jgi:glutamyl-tRNA reductase